MFFTLVTPSTDFATASARVFWAALATVPVSVTTPLSTSTLIVESRRSSAAARSKRVLTQSQPSFKPVPTVRPDSFASRWYRSLLRSYSSRVGARFVLVFAMGVGVVATLAFTFAFAFAVRLSFAVPLQPGRMIESTAKAMRPKNLFVILGKSSLVERERSSENIRAHQNMAEHAPE